MVEKKKKYIKMFGSFTEPFNCGWLILQTSLVAVIWTFSKFYLPMSLNVPYWVKRFTVHGYHTGWRVPPFMCQHLRLPHELAHCILPGWNQLVNVALLSLMRCVWMSALCCTTLLSNKLVRSDRVTWEAGCVVLMGREWGGESIDWVTLYVSYLYCLA